MAGPMVQAWESDHSRFHSRRRACLTAGEKLPDRLALLVVDHGAEVDELARSLAGQPVELRTCPDPAEALLVVGRTCPDAVLLGPATGRLDPIEFLSIVRADDPDVPVVVGADPGSGDFASRATDAGANVVVPRPYRVKQLLAVLSSLSSGAQPLDIRPMAIDLGRLKVDGEVPRMWLDGAEITLPPMEFLLLRFFAERVGSVLTREAVVRALWGETPPSSNSLNVHVARLRKRLGDDDHDPQWIRVVRRLGYQFTVPPRSPDVHPGR
ncbi:response regulator transcription factor [Saccharothrix sp. S26]|uniref:response regulator transcription factor n=1 Tax=Saccharothrix sp. S26 TaxID=2907215 RepID=UPI001F295A42|nr:response regulator transcription factor [Saccharothrix sp. S26]MCE6995483.1 response regulator transcription factor [Saccharothrix sp. S26]